MDVLIFTGTALNMALATLMGFYYWSHRTFPGFLHWTLGGFALGLGYLMIALRGVVPPAFSIFVTSLAVTLTGVLYFDGMRRFLNLSKMSRNFYAIPVVVAVNSLFLYSFFNAAPWRALVVSSVFSCFHFTTAWLALREYFRSRSTFYHIIGVEMAVASALIMFRAIWAITIPDFQLLMASPVEAVFFIAIMILQIVITICFLLLNTSRSEGDLILTQEALKLKYAELNNALAEVKTLEGILPICSNCKKIHDDNDKWVQIEVYVRDRTSAEFSHGICPECLSKVYMELADNVVKRTKNSQV